MLEDAKRGDLFGFAVSAPDFGNGPHADPAIGAPQESTPIGHVGAVNVLYGGDTGLGGCREPAWHQDISGISTNASSRDQFGEALVDGSVGSQPVIFD